MARDVRLQTGLTVNEHWFPLSLMGTFADFADLVHGPQADWGQVTCSCHPNCGVGTALMINKETKEAAPVPEFLDIPGLVADIRKLTDAARGPFFSNFMMALALFKNYKPFRAPASLALVDLLKKFDKSFGLTGKNYGKGVERRQDPWNFLFIAGMWFQDLFNYDFRRTEMCIIPYGTQEGEISFCAYNTGHGWRNIIEHMHMNATVAKWYEEHGRHQIYAGGKNVDLSSYDHSLVIRKEDAERVRPKSTLPQTTRDEKLLRRKAAKEAAQVRAYYEEMVLKKKTQGPKLVQLSS
jgi:uncharacterized radical SAM superfamily Fe-S cluster-containing enzyme